MTPKRIVLYISIFAAGFIGISLWSAWLVTHPSRIESGLTPKNFNLLFEEIALTTKDNIPIAGWFIPHLSQNTLRKGAGFISSSVKTSADAKALADKSEDKPAPTIILLHGYPAEKGDMLFIANSLQPDFNILLIDFRYFGKSGGSFTTLGTNERLDLEAAIDFLESRGFKRVGVLGFSLGGATAILQAAFDPRIAAVASYASFADVTLLGKDVYSHLPIIREALVPLMKFWARLLWSVDSAFSPKEAAKNLSTPVLIIHTKTDEQIPFHHAELLRDALIHNKQAEFYFPETGLHGELPADFDERVQYFFEKYTR